MSIFGVAPSFLANLDSRSVGPRRWLHSVLFKGASQRKSQPPEGSVVKGRESESRRTDQSRGVIICGGGGRRRGGVAQTQAEKTNRATAGTEVCINTPRPARFMANKPTHSARYEEITAAGKNINEGGAHPMAPYLPAFTYQIRTPGRGGAENVREKQEQMASVPRKKKKKKHPSC